MEQEFSHKLYVKKCQQQQWTSNWKSEIKEREKYDEDKERPIKFIQLYFYSLISHAFEFNSIITNWLNKYNDKNVYFILFILPNPQNMKTFQRTSNANKRENKNYCLSLLYVFIGVHALNMQCAMANTF